jgi:hypothetical protein
LKKVLVAEKILDGRMTSVEGGNGDIFTDH